MKLAYFDCFSGASGDMILGALMDAGLDPARIKEVLSKLPVAGYELSVRKTTKKGIGGSRAVVTIDGGHPQHFRSLSTIREMLAESALDKGVKDRSIEVFTNLAEAEAKVHRRAVDQIHFHEVGAVDAIVDVVGAVAGLRLLGVDKVICSPLHVGAGTVECAHGVLPVPAPATAELIRGKPVYSTGIQGELLTPTGAAILTTLAEDFGPMPQMVPRCIGYGAGSAELSIPNMLRVVIGEDVVTGGGYESESVAVIQTGVDDMNPQIYDYVIECLLERGALDVFLTPVQMKKNRPGTLVTVICAVKDVTRFGDFLLRETTTIGLRWRIDYRWKTHRCIRELQTGLGPIRMKVATLGDGRMQSSPEYEDCKRIARERGVTIREVMEEAMRCAAALQGAKG
jgi:uncharacterized protein (TIGR00299 family) protein